MSGYGADEITRQSFNAAIIGSSTSSPSSSSSGVYRVCVHCTART